LANLIDISYFINDLRLPASGDIDKINIAEAITLYEPEMLKKLLGATLYAAFIAGLAVTPIAQKWLDLRDGKNFTFTCDGNIITTRWEGLKGFAKKSIIAYYVFCKYFESKQEYFSGQGQVQGNSENATTVDAAPMFVKRWNEFVEIYGQVPDYLNKHSISDYVVYTDEPSAYNFLLANPTDFTDWIFTPFEKLNDFGL